MNKHTLARRSRGGDAELAGHLVQVAEASGTAAAIEGVLLGDPEDASALGGVLRQAVPGSAPLRRLVAELIEASSLSHGDKLGLVRASLPEAIDAYVSLVGRTRFSEPSQVRWHLEGRALPAPVLQALVARGVPAVGLALAEWLPHNATAEGLQAIRDGLFDAPDEGDAALVTALGKVGPAAAGIVAWLAEEGSADAIPAARSLGEQEGWEAPAVEGPSHPVPRRLRVAFGEGRLPEDGLAELVRRAFATDRGPVRPDACLCAALERLAALERDEPRTALDGALASVVADPRVDAWLRQEAVLTLAKVGKRRRLELSPSQRQHAMAVTEADQTSLRLLAAAVAGKVALQAFRDGLATRVAERGMSWRPAGLQGLLLRQSAAEAGALLEALHDAVSDVMLTGLLQAVPSDIDAATDPAFVGVIARRLGEPSGAVRAAAVDALLAMGARGALHPALADPDPAVAIHVAEALGREGDRGDLAALLEATERGPTAVRTAAMNAADALRSRHPADSGLGGAMTVLAGEGGGLAVAGAGQLSGAEPGDQADPVDSAPVLSVAAAPPVTGWQALGAPPRRLGPGVVYTHVLLGRSGVVAAVWGVTVPGLACCGGMVPHDPQALLGVAIALVCLLALLVISWGQLRLLRDGEMALAHLEEVKKVVTGRGKNRRSVQRYTWKVTTASGQERRWTEDRQLRANRLEDDPVERVLVGKEITACDDLIVVGVGADGQLRAKPWALVMASLVLVWIGAGAWLCWGLLFV